jgi:Ricin-type beta-trefoil lectin domain-like
MKISLVRRSLTAAVGATIVVVLSFAPPAAATGGADLDSSPFVGGAAIGNNTVPGAPDCTSAFPWFRYSGNGYGMLSAGHCYTGMNVNDSANTPAQFMGYVNISSVDFNGSSALINGAFHGDFSLIEIEAPKLSAPMIYRRIVSGTRQVNVQSMWSRPAAVGDQFCTDGRMTGEQCGWTVTDLNQQPNNFHPLVKATKPSGSCIIHGDSGGPVYTVLASGDVVAKGIISSSPDPQLGSPCVMYFTDIWDVTAAMPDGHLLTVDNPAPPIWHYGAGMQIKNEGTSTCLVTSGPASGNLAWTTWCGIRYADQVWTTYALGSGRVRFVNNNSGLCLGAPYWTNYVPAQVGCGDYDDQKWVIDNPTASWTRIRMVQGSQCLIAPSQSGAAPYLGSCDASIYGYWSQL